MSLSRRHSHAPRHGRSPTYDRKVTLADLAHRLGQYDGEIVVGPTSRGPGNWAGAPSAVCVDNVVWLAYRLRRPVGGGRGYANVIARSEDGVRFEEVARLTSDEFGAASLERPALVTRPEGGWRVYVSCATHGSKHWWVETVDAEELEKLPAGERRMILPGDKTSAWKDVVVHAGGLGWRMWACRHPLDGGDDEADRMETWYAVSADGLYWTVRSRALGPQAGAWDARGTRITAVVEADGCWYAFYDGRATAAQNWHEHTGLARGYSPDTFPARSPLVGADEPTLRYVSVVEVGGGYRAYMEVEADDGTHELRTVCVAQP